MHHYTLRMAREHRVLPKEYRLYRTVMPFGWCLCALLIVVCLHLWKCIAATATHHISAWHMSQFLAFLGGHQLKRHEWPNLWMACHLGCDPSHQVWLRENSKAMICSHTRRVSKLDWDGFIDLASCGPNAHPMVLG